MNEAGYNVYREYLTSLQGGKRVSFAEQNPLRGEECQR